MIRSLLKPLASLRLTVVLLALTMLLVLAGTFAQIDTGIWQVQKTYFHSFFCWVGMSLFLPRESVPANALLAAIVKTLKPIGFPMPGGYTLIALLLMNLIAAHAVRFKFTTKRIGVILIHAGLIALICGEVVTSLFTAESQIVIDEGQTVSFSQDTRSPELAIIDTTPADHDEVVAIPSSRLATNRTISYPTLPFSLRIDAYYPNSSPLGPMQMQQMGISPPVRVTRGGGTRIAVMSQPPTNGTSSEIDIPSMYVTALAPDGTPLDTYLLSTMELSMPGLPSISAPQELVVNGRRFLLSLRWKRSYKPYSMTLLSFTHDRYTGTDVPKNFASLVRLVDPSRHEDRQVKIWMNHPLRYAGETFYQASFKPGDKTTILQVVRNPGWLIPYISCSAITLGLIVHFGAHLARFLSRALGAGASSSAAHLSGTSTGPQQYVLKPNTGGIVWPATLTLVCLAYLLNTARPLAPATKFDLDTFARVPISYEGRVMPLDSVARTAMKVISGKSQLRLDDGKKIPAIQWLAELFASTPTVHDYKILRIDLPDVLDLLGLDDKRKMFSYDEVVTKADAINEQLDRIREVPAKDRTLFQKSLFDLAEHANLVTRLNGMATLYLAPPFEQSSEWRTFEDSARETAAAPANSAASRRNPGVAAFQVMRQAYAINNPDLFNAAARDYLEYLDGVMPSVVRRAKLEYVFNTIEPFYHGMILYVIVFLLICASWLISPARATLQRSAYWILLLTLALHTTALVARIYLSGRPPVTNLYSSAVFIGWAATVFCVVIEKIYRNGIGSFAAAVVAFPSLIIAHYLAASGDTMQMLQAVLDTNIWLATHVVVITLGYSATFLAGSLGCIYAIGTATTSALRDDSDNRRTLSRMIYGIVCFAMLFSFVGTILGGIWADQSWGRFWGWDPKENGAVLIVLWNAIVLHARWAGLARERGVANLAVFGNIVTAWSWFGTNMLGVGLHSYGFMDSAVFWLSAFMASQLAIIGVGLLPRLEAQAE